MEKKLKWEDVTTYECLIEYINTEIGPENCYDELFLELMSGMIYNREQKKKQDNLNKNISDMGGIVMPSKND